MLLFTVTLHSVSVGYVTDFSYVYINFSKWYKTLFTFAYITKQIDRTTN